MGSEDNRTQRDGERSSTPATAVSAPSPAYWATVVGTFALALVFLIVAMVVPSADGFLSLLPVSLFFSLGVLLLDQVKKGDAGEARFSYKEISVTGSIVTFAVVFALIMGGYYLYQTYGEPASPSAASDEGLDRTAGQEAVPGDPAADADPAGTGNEPVSDPERALAAVMHTDDPSALLIQIPDGVVLGRLSLDEVRAATPATLAPHSAVPLFFSTSDDQLLVHDGAREYRFTHENPDDVADYEPRTFPFFLSVYPYRDPNTEFDIVDNTPDAPVLVRRGRIYNRGALGFYHPRLNRYFVVMVVEANHTAAALEAGTAYSRFSVVEVLF